MRNNKGFTLAELLIVVAIVAVLVSIAIPMFWTQLEKARERNDVANARSAYSQVRTCALTGSTAGFDVNFDGVTYTKSFMIEQTRAGWLIPDHDIKGLEAQGEPEPHVKCVVSCKKYGDPVVYWNGVPNTFSGSYSWTHNGGAKGGVGQQLIHDDTTSGWNNKTTTVDRPLDAVVGAVIHIKATDDEELKKYSYGMFIVKASDPDSKLIIQDTNSHSFSTSNDITIKDDTRSGYTGEVEVYIQLINKNGNGPSPEESKKLLSLISIEWKK